MNTVGLLYLRTVLFVRWKERSGPAAGVGEFVSQEDLVNSSDKKDLVGREAGVGCVHPETVRAEKAKRWNHFT